MYITIGDILQAGIIPDMQTLTAPPHFASLPVEHTSIQGIYELPIRSFIREHELVFSSAIGDDSEAPRYIELMDEVYDGKGSAIILTFQTPDYRPPGAVLDHASKLEMPLFLIPWERRLFETQMDIINLMSTIKMRAINELQNALFNLSFESQSLDAAAAKIARSLEVPVCISSLNGGVLAQSGESGGLTIENAAEKAEILLNGRPVGWLLLGGSGGEEDAVSDPDILGQFVCFPLSLWFYRKNVEDLTVAKLKNDFVWKVANASLSSFEEMVYQGRQLGFDLSRSYTCLLLENLRGQATRAAHFTCSIACAFPNGDTITAEDYAQGAIAYAPQGEGGFGYDPVFFYPPMKKTFGQLTAEEKHAISHRGKALAVFQEKLAAYLNR